MLANIVTLMVATMIFVTIALAITNVFRRFYFRFTKKRKILDLVGQGYTPVGFNKDGHPVTFINDKKQITIL